MSAHLNDERLSARRDGALAPVAAAEVDRHLGTCAECRERLAALIALDASLARSLAHDPGEAHFAELAGRIETRIAATPVGREPVPSPMPPPAWRSPRTLAWAGGALGLAAVAALSLMLARTNPPPLGARAAQPSELSARVAAPQRAAPPAAAPQAAAPSLDAPRPATPEAPPSQEQSGPRRTPVRPRGAEVEPNVSGGLAQKKDVARERSEATALAPRANAPAAPIASSAGAANDAGAGANLSGSPAAKQAAPMRVMQMKTLPNGEQVAVPAPGAPALPERAGLQLPNGMRKPPARPLALGVAGPAPAASEDAASAAAGQLCGEVRDDRGRPVAGASVSLTGSGAGGTSDAEGAFCFAAPDSAATLQVLAVGYRACRLELEPGARASRIEVTLRAAEALPAGGYSPFAKAPSAPRDEASWGAALDATRAAERDTLPSRWDHAARLWAIAAGRSTGAAAADEARFHVAEARVHAWRLGRTEARRSAGVRAVDAYLSAGGDDPLHALGRRWRAELAP
ncbi:MAG TPA: carboxypeptidase regulatory-like domain-containing protein [Candidatus Acidoferrales bacterium]|nr:carboxypeptidase regulatory-like domain-containing protein [Candidatus Acidoferrales bacterium]